MSPTNIDYSRKNDVERINLSMRDSIPKGNCVYSIEHLQSLVELKRIHYNFLQKHPSFANFTPAKLVGIDLPINSWIDLFRIADFYDRRIGHHFT